MQPEQQRPRVLYSSEVLPRLREEVSNERGRLIQALTAINDDLPREAGGFMDAVSPPDYPNCFTWPRVFLHKGRLWRLFCVVTKTGWPRLLWIVHVYADWLPDSSDDPLPNKFRPR